MTGRDLNWAIEALETLHDEIEESKKCLFDIKMEYMHTKKCLAEEKMDE